MICSYTVDDKSLLFNRLTMKKAVVDSNIAEFIRKRQKDIDFEALFKLEFGDEIFNEIKPLLETEENYKEKLMQTSNFFKRKFNIFYIILTTQCNLECEYCFGNRKILPHMNYETAKKIIKVIGRFGNGSERIIFYGGEPTLNWDVLKFLIKGLKNIGFNDFVIISNGYSFEEPEINFIKKYNVNVALSLDGRKNENDIARKSINGISSYNNVYETLEKLKQNDIPFSISCTVGKHNYKSLGDITIFFIENLKARGVSFNLLRGDSSNFIDFRLSTEAILHAFAYLREKGIYEDRIMRKAKAFVNEEIFMADCLGRGQQLTFLPDGDVGCCHIETMDGTVFTNVFHKKIIQEIINTDFLDKWKNQIPLLNPECNECEYLFICGGGCPLNCIEKGYGNNLIDKDFCAHTRSVFEWLAEDLITKTGKLL
jgi:uncharacterized protein